MKKYFKLVLLILWMGIIFYFSAQPSQESTIQTNIVVDVMYKIYCNIFGGKLDFNTFNGFLFKPVRKIAHFSEYALLGILAYINIKEYINRKPYIASIIFSLLYAISDEIHQIFVPGRYCAILDMAIDVCGATVGIFIIHLILTRWKRD